MPIPRPTRFAYKDEYEKFKLYLTIILIVISFSCRFLLNSRCARWAGLGRGQGHGSDLGLGWDKDKAQTLLLCTPLPRVTDAAFNFLLVWYYCTLTIRESILINNGSRCACAVGWVMAHRDFVSGGAALLHGVTGTLL